MLSHPALRLLSDTLTIRYYAAGETILLQGDPADAFYNITDGVVRLFKLLSDGRRQVIGFLYRGDFIGLSAPVVQGCGAEAVNAVTAYHFPREPFRRLLKINPELETELLSRAYDELYAAESQMLLLGRKTAAERVASFLVDLARRAARAGGDTALIFLPMNRADIADYLGLTTETVSRAITKLKTAKLIQLLDQGWIRILQPIRLNALAEAITA